MYLSNFNAESRNHSRYFLQEETYYKKLIHIRSRRARSRLDHKKLFPEKYRTGPSATFQGHDLNYLRHTSIALIQESGNCNPEAATTATVDNITASWYSESWKMATGIQLQKEFTFSQDFVIV